MFNVHALLLEKLLLVHATAGVHPVLVYYGLFGSGSARPPERMLSYVPQYKFSNFFGRQDFEARWRAFCFLCSNKKHAVYFQVSKHLTRMSHVDHDNIIVD
jgi:hypothetical protein